MRSGEQASQTMLSIDAISLEVLVYDSGPMRSCIVILEHKTIAGLLCVRKNLRLHPTHIEEYSFGHMEEIIEMSRH